jgi:ankyrin repeat protein
MVWDSAMHEAIKAGHTEIVGLLLAHGADPVRDA